MKNTYRYQHGVLIEKILEALPRKADASLREFVRQFYAKVPAPELARLAPANAIALAESAYGFMASRKPGTPKIRIFVPKKAKDGYDCKNTVIELLNDDMPFLVDSLSAELSRHGLSIRETLHPIFTLTRDAKGALKTLGQKSDAQLESLIHFEISSLPDDMSQEQLIFDLEWVLQHIRASVDDWRTITQRAQEHSRKLEVATQKSDREEVREVQDFLRWLADRNFVFLGYAEYDFYDAKGKESLKAIDDSRLGILTITDELSPQGVNTLPAEARHFLHVPQLIEISKSTRRSPVHRAVPMDYIGLKRFDANGKVVGEARFLGLFTSNVYYQSTESIPLVRKKVAHVMARSEFDASSHDGKSLKAILEFLPRDEIFQMTEDELFEAAMGILALEAKPGVRMFVRRDAFERFVSAMVFVPREQFSTELRKQIQSIVEKAFNGVSSTFSTQITEAPLARLHLIVKTPPGDIPGVDHAQIEAEIAKRAYLWSDLLFDRLQEAHAEKQAASLHRAYANAFPQSYINRYNVAAALYDIEKVEASLATGGMVLDLFSDKHDAEGFWHLKIYNPMEEIALSDILPMLENCGFRVVEEQPFLIVPHGDVSQVRIRDFKLQLPAALTANIEDVKAKLEEAMLRVWHAEMENDRFNTLVLTAGLTWRQVVMLRAYARYLRQVGFNYGQQAIEQAFGNHPSIVRMIVSLFEARFQPDMKNAAKQQQLEQAIEDALASVSNAAEDRIFRRYAAIITATLRTNYFQTKKIHNNDILSFKFNSASVPDLPLPKPFAEIFVYGMRVEGIHLRGGKVARGGLRWSDRHEDFRTEVLGLMKAQMVKNSVIVPVGSKGGFVVKRPPAAGGREALLEEGIACYTMYLQGLLDITDNIVKGKIVPPAQVVRHDEDDPYLVVAADKGTATFSDIANSVSEAYGFWLGDAFASGGSVGYDHKKMAITARGAWVSVTRHFREVGVDISKQEFTVAGIGDMAGDVFGNGMLLSENIKLVAAFNHMHIFLDPNPDAKASFKERERLFNLPRSTWKDYDAALISKGGGIFERSAKTIALSKEAQAALGFSKANPTPDELIRAILLAPVDLLWNGGIGTYVKAEDETHEQVGDRANNSVRVNGHELRCKIVGEGGNLGFTQKGRIEYGRAGGRINTDAIDNSAGVDCSDHEVNIKIAFSQLMSAGTLTRPKRDKQLAAMTDEVATLVLKDNILQTQAVTVAELQGAQLIESQTRLIHSLEKTGLLNRAIEFLPDDRQLAELKAARRGLTRPEIAVLLAYSKMALYKDMLDSSLPDEGYFHSDLKRYFPVAMQREFEAAIEAHPLKREIIATVMTNSIVNRAGITFFSDIAGNTDADVRDIAAAYAMVRDAFGLRNLWKEIEALDYTVDVSVQVEMHAAITRFLERATTWLLRHMPHPLDIDKISAEIMPAVAELDKARPSFAGDTEVSAQHLVAQGVTASLAQKIAALPLMSSAFDIIAVAKQSGVSLKDAASAYFTLGARFRLGWLRASAEAIPAVTHWDRLALQSIVNDLYDEQRRLTSLAVAKSGGVESSPEAERTARFMEELQSADAPDLARLMVALGQVRAVG